MKKKWNWPIWVGFLVVLAGLFSYPLFLIDYPLFRDFLHSRLLVEMDPADVRASHAAAADWYRRHGAMARR